MKKAKLIYTCGPDWLWATGITVSDPHFLYIDTKGESHAVVSPLEYDLAREKSHIKHVYSYEEMTQRLQGEKASLVNCVAYFFENDDAETISVPEDFSALVYTKLQAAKLPVVVVEGFIFPERMIKTSAEIDKLHAAQKMNEQGFVHVRSILEKAEIDTQTQGLLWKEVPLTSEILQCEMNSFLALNGAESFPHGPICAGGAQAAIPHDNGSGQLYANQLIIVDSFPQHKNGYFGDLTRTYIKGTPTDWQRKVYNTVLEAQELALSLMKPEEDLRKIQKEVSTFFQDKGFETGQTKDGRYYGYIHSIGHHIGLKVHDGAQTRTEADLILQPGHVVTVEPGLYYPKGVMSEGFGGCRIEDFVTITEEGCKNLTFLSKSDWIVK